MGHYGNWELGGAGSSQHPYQLYVIYRPLSNKLFNDLIIKMRTRLGTKLIPMKETFRQLIATKDDGELSVTAFIADQTASPENSYWTTFLNQDTAVFWGTEVLAAKLNYPVVFLSIDRVKRGYYVMDTELLCENPADTEKGEISEMHTRKLEEIIRNKPELWLWSHRRWKHKKPA
jgi:KDO2-lipid IV(A) lauroyltransferase